MLPWVIGFAVWATLSVAIYVATNGFEFLYYEDEED